MGCSSSSAAGTANDSTVTRKGKKVTLGYWSIRAGHRGHVNRHLLAYAGVDFEDKRYDFKDNAAEWKEKDKKNLGIEFPNLPYIIDGDFKLTESKAVTRYICERWKPELLGSGPQE